MVPLARLTVRVALQLRAFALRVRWAGGLNAKEPRQVSVLTPFAVVQCSGEEMKCGAASRIFLCILPAALRSKCILLLSHVLLPRMPVSSPPAITKMYIRNGLIEGEVIVPLPA
jgi:hypothetical protein